MAATVWIPAFAGMTAGAECENDEAECGNDEAEVGNGGVERTGMTGKIDGDGAIIVRFNPMPAHPNR